eukprot:1160044-Pelagomonas_calceolata.AAC.7
MPGFLAPPGKVATPLTCHQYRRKGQPASLPCIPHLPFVCMELHAKLAILNAANQAKSGQCLVVLHCVRPTEGLLGPSISTQPTQVVGAGEADL